MSIIEFPVTALRICIDEIDENDTSLLTGRIGGVGIEEIYSFSNSYNLLLLIDNLLDMIGRPQASREYRIFSKEIKQRTSGYNGDPKRYHESAEILQLEGKIKTKDAYFISRMRSTWQGFMKDSQGKIIGEFESDLDFLSLLVMDRNITV